MNVNLILNVLNVNENVNKNVSEKDKSLRKQWRLKSRA